MLDIRENSKELYVGSRIYFLIKKRGVDEFRILRRESHEPNERSQTEVINYLTDQMEIWQNNGENEYKTAEYIITNVPREYNKGIYV